MNPLRYVADGSQAVGVNIFQTFLEVVQSNHKLLDVAFDDWLDLFHLERFLIQHGLENSMDDVAEGRGVTVRLSIFKITLENRGSLATSGIVDHRSRDEDVWLDNHHIGVSYTLLVKIGRRHRQCVAVFIGVGPNHSDDVTVVDPELLGPLMLRDQLELDVTQALAVLLIFLTVLVLLNKSQDQRPLRAAVLRLLHHTEDLIGERLVRVYLHGRNFDRLQGRSQLWEHPVRVGKVPLGFGVLHALLR